MQAKWLNGFNESTQQNEQFYPITHKDAIIGAEEFVLTEEADEIEGDIPDIDPVVNNRINEIIAYVNEKLAHAGSGSGGSGSTAPAKLEMYTLHVIATTDGQTTFGISLSDFDSSRDYVLVQSERLMLSPDLDFTISGKNIVLNEGVENGRNITIYIFKSADKDDEESGGGSFSVLDIPDGTITLTKLVEPVLPLRGGTLSGDLNFTRSNSDKKTQIFHYGDHSFIRNMEADGKTYADIYFSTNTIPQYRGKDGIDYDIYGEHNPQPSNNNILINSDFRNPVNQRGYVNGTNFDNKYFIDRWKGAGCNTLVKNKYMTTNVVTGTTSNILMQPLEFPEIYTGKQITVSIRCRTANPVQFQLFMDGQTSDGYYSLGYPVFRHSQANTWEEFKYTFTIPSNKTFNFLVCGFNTSGSFDIEWMKAEEGKYATPYVARTYTEELVLCKRYFERLYLNSSESSPYAGFNLLPYTVKYSVLILNYFNKRTKVPTITIPDNALSLCSIEAGPSYASYSTIAITSISKFGVSDFGQLVLNHADTSYPIRTLKINPGFYIDIDAEL